jgi:hypothetical protein
LNEGFVLNKPPFVRWIIWVVQKHLRIWIVAVSLRDVTYADALISFKRIYEVTGDVALPLTVDWRREAPEVPEHRQRRTLRLDLEGTRNSLDAT